MSQITFEETENMSNQDFMSWVFENFGQLIWYTAKKYCWTEGLWEEIMQESLLRLLSCIPRLRKLSEQKLAGYICHHPQHHLRFAVEGGEEPRKLHLFGVHRHSRGWTRAGGDHPSKRADRATRESMLGLA